MAVYIASDSPLPLVPWNQDQPDFHVDELQGEKDEIVRRQFSKPYVYYAGSHTYCSCGFEYGRYPDEDNTEGCRRSVSRLSQYLTQMTARFGPIELFACWEGDQAENPEHSGVIAPRNIGGESFWFEEKQFLVILPDGQEFPDLGAI